MSIESYSPIQLEAYELIADKGTDLVKIFRYESLIKNNSWAAKTLPILQEASQHLEPEILKLTSDYSLEHESMAQQELETLRVDFGYADNRLSLGLVRRMNGWNDQDTQISHVIVRLGKNAKHLALSVLNRDRCLLISR